MSEETVDVEIVTEFDRALGKYTKRLFVGIAVMVLMFLGIEFTLIFFMLSDHSVLRLQTANGALVGGAGLAIIAFSSAYFLWPTKLMGWEALKITREMKAKSDDAVVEMKEAAASMSKFVLDVKPLVVDLSKAVSGTRLDELTVRFERKMDEAIDAFGGNDPVDSGVVIDPKVAERIRARARGEKV
jgi:hypothetical protein